jgi:hypothetical protein
MNQHTPSRSSEAYVPPTLAQGKVIKSGRKVNKILDMVSDMQKKTADFMVAMTGMQQIVSDSFDRIAKGLPKRDGSFMYSCPIDMIANGTSEENVALWQLPAGKFKSWMWQVSKEGLNFEHVAGDSLSRVDCVAAALRLLEEWEPVRTSTPAWACHPEAMVVASLVAAVCHQKYYLDRALPPTAPLHGLLSLLHRWGGWEGPASHAWNLYLSLVFFALLSGVELTDQSYHTPYPAPLLEGLLPVCDTLVRVLGADTTRREAYQSDPSDRLDPQEAFNNCRMYYTTKVFRELNTCVRAKDMFPQLRLAPLTALIAATKRNLGMMPLMGEGRQILDKLSAFIATE